MAGAAPQNAARYDALIATLEKDPALNSDPQKKKALEALQNAKKNNTQLKLEELTKVRTFSTPYIKKFFYCIVNTS